MGAWICSIYHEVHYIEVRYIKVWGYVRKLLFIITGHPFNQSLEQFWCKPQTLSLSLQIFSQSTTKTYVWIKYYWILVLPNSQIKWFETQSETPHVGFLALFWQSKKWDFEKLSYGHGWHCQVCTPYIIFTEFLYNFLNYLLDFF